MTNTENFVWDFLYFKIILLPCSKFNLSVKLKPHMMNRWPCVWDKQDQSWNQQTCQRPTSVSNLVYSSIVPGPLLLLCIYLRFVCKCSLQLCIFAINYAFNQFHILPSRCLPPIPRRDVVRKSLAWYVWINSSFNLPLTLLRNTHMLLTPSKKHLNCLMKRTTRKSAAGFQKWLPLKTSRKPYMRLVWQTEDFTKRKYMQAASSTLSAGVVSNCPHCLPVQFLPELLFALMVVSHLRYLSLSTQIDLVWSQQPFTLLLCQERIQLCKLS